MPAHDVRLQDVAKTLATATQTAAQAGGVEQTFRIAFQGAIKQSAHELALALTAVDEFRMLEGRADTVYNRLVIEYERPGFLKPSNKHGNNQHAIQQAKDYIGGLHRRERHAKERYAGVVCDGHYFIFLQFREGDWHVEPPVPVDT